MRVVTHNQPDRLIMSGAPNENMVQTHLTLLNVFQYLNGRYTYFYPLKKFLLFGFPSWKFSDPKIIAIKRAFSKISARKKAPENSSWPL